MTAHSILSSFPTVDIVKLFFWTDLGRLCTLIVILSAEVSDQGKKTIFVSLNDNSLSLSVDKCMEWI